MQRWIKLRRRGADHVVVPVRLTLSFLLWLPFAALLALVGFAFGWRVAVALVGPWLALAVLSLARRGDDLVGRLFGSRAGSAAFLAAVAASVGAAAVDSAFGLLMAPFGFAIGWAAATPLSARRGEAPDPGRQEELGAKAVAFALLVPAIGLVVAVVIAAIAKAT